MPIKIAITDDHPIVVDGLKNSLQAHADFEVTGTYHDGKSLLAGLSQSRPDILLLDMQLPDKSGSELVPEILQLHPDLRIIILSGIESHMYVVNMMQQGCMGYLLKNTTNQEMLERALKTVYEGEIFMDPELKNELFLDIMKAKKRKTSTLPKLTHREKEILLLVIQELGNQEIADKLCLSIRTIENHRYNLLQKLDVKNTVGLIKKAMQMGLV